MTLLNTLKAFVTITPETRIVKACRRVKTGRFVATLGTSLVAGGATKEAALHNVLFEAAKVAEAVATAVFCKDGTVLLVQYRNGHWGYNILQPGSHASMCSPDPYVKVLAAAREHAAQSYGGVIFERNVGGARAF